MKSRILLCIFILCLFADQVCIYYGLNEYRFVTKLSLVPLLLVHYLTSSLSKNSFFVFGLVFSFLGDLFLLFEWGFLFGLGSFFLAHIFYILCFKQFKISKPKKLILVLGIYITLLIWILYPYLNEMKIPVILYGIVISTMLYFAVATKDKMLIVGAILFEN